MTTVAVTAEKLGHHPNWSNVYNKVDILLFKHEAKDSIAEKDLKLSKEIDKNFNKGQLCNSFQSFPPAVEKDKKAISFRFIFKNGLLKISW